VTPSRLHHDSHLLAGGAVISGAIWAFLWVAYEVLSGKTRHFDEWLLAALRDPEQPARPLGPAWLASAAMDIRRSASS
jgi:undecaprenyl-diphosphatase